MINIWEGATLSQIPDVIIFALCSNVAFVAQWRCPRFIREVFECGARNMNHPALRRPVGHFSVPRARQC